MDKVIALDGEEAGYGNYVVIDHGMVNGKRLTSKYAHMYPGSFQVKQGDKVAKGQVLGDSASTGNSTGPHLHFEVRMDGEVIDPLDLFDGELANASIAGGSSSNAIVRKYGENQFQGTIKLRRVAPDKAMGKADPSVAQGTTTALGGEQINENADVSTREKYIKTWQQGAILYLNTETKLYTYENPREGKPELKNPYVMKDNGQDIRILQGTQLTYLGEYKVQTSFFWGKVTEIYVKVKYEDKEGYVESRTIDIKRSVNLVSTKPENATDGKGKYNSSSNNNNSSSNTTNNNQNGNTTRNNSNTTNNNNNQNKSAELNLEDNEMAISKISMSAQLKSSLANGTEEEKDGEEGKEEEDKDSDGKKRFLNNKMFTTYKIALSVGGAEGNPDEVEKSYKVIKKVQELLERELHNIKITLTGNKYDEKTKKIEYVSEEERRMNARDVGANVSVEVRLNPEAGIDAIYRENDGYGMELASKLTEAVSEKLEAENKNAGTDVEKLQAQSPALNNYADTNVASAILRAEGGKIQDDAGIEKCADGIKEAIIGYLESDHAGDKAVAVRQEYETDSIKSTVVSLEYVPKSEYDKAILSRGSSLTSPPLNLFTIDTEGNLLTTSWSYSGSLQVRQNVPINLKTTFNKYSTPWEYIFIYYVQMDHRGFASDLADEIINNSEFVVTLQDNVSTTQVNDGTGTDSVTTALDVTYARTWFAEIYKESSFSSAALQLTDNEVKKTNVKGVATYKELKDEHNNITKILECKYDLGEGQVRERIDIFAKLFKENDLNARLQPSWIIDFVESEEKASRMSDLTKYLIYRLSDMYLGVDFIDFEEMYKLAHFDNVSLMTAGGVISGSTLQETVWYTLINFGLTEYQAAGIMGNITQESSWNPNATDGGLGLFQLTEGRAENLKKYAASKGKDWSDPAMQLEFLMGELTPGGGCNGLANYEMSSAYVADWNGANSPEAAAEAFCRGWERAGTPVMERRTSEARRFYEMFKGKRPPQGGFVGSGNYFIPGRGYIYYQGMPEWADFPFGNGGGFAFNGCGPTAVAMCISDLLGQQVTPVDAWVWTNGKYAFSNGMGFDYPLAAAEHYGLQGQRIDTEEQLRQALNEGKKIISSHSKSRGSPFPVNAHIVYYAGQDAGGVIVKDPNGSHADIVDDERYQVSDLWRWSCHDLGGNWAIWK